MPKKKRFCIKEDILKQWSGYGVSGKTLLEVAKWPLEGMGGVRLNDLFKGVMVNESAQGFVLSSLLLLCCWNGWWSSAATYVICRYATNSRQNQIGQVLGIDSAMTN